MRYCNDCATFVKEETGTCETCSNTICRTCMPSHEQRCGHVAIADPELPFGEPPPEPVRSALASTPAPAMAKARNGTGTVSLYTADSLRNAIVKCRHCQRDNYETRFWCTHCGHGLGMPMAECVCETCLKAQEPGHGH